jgi:hypothetical protein
MRTAESVWARQTRTADRHIFPLICSETWRAQQIGRKGHAVRIDVRKEMAACVRKLGGVVLDDSLENPQFSNADYWFPKHQVIAELKCLTENLVAKREFNERLSKLYASWVRRGLIPQTARGRITFRLRDIPVKCAREFLDPIKRRLDANVLKKANEQIKGTKKHFNASSAKGLLLLANDGDYMFPPEMMAHLLARSMKEQHRSIHSAVYFSVNELVTVPGVSLPSLFWIDGLLPNREPVPEELRDLLQRSWIAHYSGLVPGPIYEMPMKNEPDVLGSIKFAKRAT